MLKTNLCINLVPGLTEGVLWCEGADTASKLMLLIHFVVFFRPETARDFKQVLNMAVRSSEERGVGQDCAGTVRPEVPGAL